TTLPPPSHHDALPILVEEAHTWIFVKTGLQHWMRNTSAQATTASRGSTRDARYYRGQVYVWTENYLIAAAFTTLTFLVRLLVLRSEEHTSELQSRENL